MKKIRWMRKAFAVFMLVMMVMPAGGYAAVTTHTLDNGATITIGQADESSAATGAAPIVIPAAVEQPVVSSKINGVSVDTNVNVDNTIITDNDNTVIVNNENNNASTGDGTTTNNNDTTINIDNNNSNSIDNNINIDIDVNVELSEGGWGSSPWWHADGNNAGHAKGCNCTYNLRHCGCDGNAKNCTCLHGGHQPGCSCNEDKDCSCGGKASECECNKNTCGCGNSGGNCGCDDNCKGGSDCKCDNNSQGCDCGSNCPGGNDCACGCKDGGDCNCGKDNTNCGGDNDDCNCPPDGCDPGECGCDNDCGGDCNCDKGTDNNCGGIHDDCDCPVGGCPSGECPCEKKYPDGCGNDDCDCKKNKTNCGGTDPDCDCPVGGCDPGECPCENDGDQDGCGKDDCDCKRNDPDYVYEFGFASDTSLARTFAATSSTVSNATVEYNRGATLILNTNVPAKSTVTFYRQESDGTYKAVSSPTITEQDQGSLSYYHAGTDCGVYTYKASINVYGSDEVINTHEAVLNVVQIKPTLTIASVEQVNNKKDIKITFTVNNPNAGLYPSSLSGTKYSPVRFSVAGIAMKETVDLPINNNTQSAFSVTLSNISVSQDGNYRIAATYADGDRNYYGAETATKDAFLSGSGTTTNPTPTPVPGGTATAGPIWPVVTATPAPNTPLTTPRPAATNSSTSSSSKLTTLTDNDTPLAGGGPVVRLLDQQGKELEVYDSTIQPGSGGMVKCNTTYKRKHYTYEFNVAEMRAYANYYPQGEYQIEADGIAFDMPYAFHGAFAELNDYLTENNISINTLRLRATFEAMDDFTTKTALTNSPGVELDSPLWRVSFSLHDPLGTDIGFDTDVDSLEVPLEIQLATSQTEPVAVIFDPATETLETPQAKLQKGRAIIEANYPADYGVGSGEATTVADDGGTTTSSAESGEGVG